MIWKTYIAAKTVAEETYYEPPTRVIDLTVIGGECYLDIYKVDGMSGQLDGEAIASVETNAKSLLLALQAAVTDDEWPRSGKETTPSNE